MKITSITLTNFKFVTIMVTEWKGLTMVNSRFAVAIHILALLAIENSDTPITSEYLAYSASTNPVVIRRILIDLRRAGLVTAQPGSGGGVSLACCPDRVTLLEVYHAVEKSSMFTQGLRKPNPDCICGRNIQPVLENEFIKAEQAAEHSLSETTIADIVHRVEECDLAQVNRDRLIG